MISPKRRVIHNFYLQGALAILLTVLVFSLGYLINKNVPADSGGDLLSNAPSLLEYLKGSPYLLSHWSNAYSELGSYGVFPGSPILYLQFLFLLITKDLFSSFKLLQIAEIFCAGFFMFATVYSLTKRRFESIFAGALYMLAPFNLLRVQGHIYIAWSFAFIPLVYLATYKTLTRGKLNYAVLAGLPLLFAITTYQENIFLLGIPLLIFSLLITFTYGRLSFRKVIKRILLIFVMFGFALWMGLTSFLAIIGTFFESIFIGSYPVTTASTGAYAFPNPPLSALMLFDGEVLKISAHLTQANLVLIAFSLTLIVLSSVFLFFKRTSLSISLFITGLISVIFSMGVSAPSALGFFIAAQKYVPYFNGIVTPGRFVMSAYFALVFLGVVGLGGIYTRIRPLARKLKYKVRLKGTYFRLLGIAAMACLILVPGYILSSAYSLQTMNLPVASTQTTQFLNSNDSQNAYRAVDLVSHNGLLYILGQRTSRIAWDLVCRYYSSPSFAEILAKDNIKYIVASNSTNQFVFGGNLNFNQILSNSLDFSAINLGSSTIYVNKLADPRIYAGSGALIIGGPNALSLLYAQGDTANDIPFYAQQLLQDNMTLPQMLDATVTTVFHDSDALDLSFMLINQSYLLQPWRYANGNWTIIQDNNGRELPAAYVGSVDGQLNFANFTIYTNKKTEIQIPYTFSSSGSYDIWIRAKSDSPWREWGDPWDYSHYYRAFEPPPLNNSIIMSLDGFSLGRINFAEVGGFKWIKVGTVNSSSGPHELQISTSSNPFYLDSVAVVPKGTLENKLNNVSDLLNASNVNSLYLLEFSNDFKLIGNGVRDFFVPYYTSDSASGYLALAMGSNATANVFVAKAGDYVFQVRASNKMFDLSVDGALVSLSSTSQVNAGTISYWTWYSGSDYLSQGYHNITVVARNFVEMDMLSFQSLPQNNSPASQLSYSQLNPSEWTGNLTTNQPTQLVLTENFVPDWSLQLSTNEGVRTLQPYPALYFLNAYNVNTNDTASYKINYELSTTANNAQNFEEVGYVVWVIVLVLTLVPVSVLKKKNSSRNPKQRAKPVPQRIINSSCER